jgi:hypothetical protein
MHPDTPPWAESHYNLMLMVYQVFTGYRRNRDAETLELRARVATLETKVARLERITLLPPAQSPDEEPTNPGRRE